MREVRPLQHSFRPNRWQEYSAVLPDWRIRNLHLLYNPREGTDLYLVYNHGINTDLRRSTPFRPRLRDRTLLVKYAYTFSR